MANDVAVRETSGAKLVADIVLQGDLSRLTPEQKVEYYNGLCSSLGLNPLTRPFQYLRLSGKEVLYATKDASEQLRKINGVSVTKLERETIGNICMMTAYGVDKTGRSDVATAALSMVYPDTYRDRNGNVIEHPKSGKPLSGEDLSNALMKLETKCKRRLTLSICGLGVMDETEIETVPYEKNVTVAMAQAEREIPDTDLARRKVNELVERYAPFLSEEYIANIDIEMDGASVDKMREIYLDIKREGAKAEKRADREEDAARVAPAEEKELF